MKEKIKKRWLALIAINLLIFSTPAGDCGSDLATGFPFIASTWDHTTHVFTFNTPFFFLNLAFVFFTVGMFAVWFKSRTRFLSAAHSLAGKITLLYAFTASLPLAIMWVVNADDNIFIYYAWPYYFAGFPFLWFLKLFKGTVLEVKEFETLFRLALLPNVVTLYFLFYGILRLWDYLKKKYNPHLPLI